MNYIQYIIYIIIGLIILYFIIRFIYPNKTNVTIFTFTTLMFQIIAIAGFFISRIDQDRQNRVELINNYIQQNEKIWIDTEKLFLNNTDNDPQLLELYNQMFNNIHNNTIVDIDNKEYYNNIFNNLNPKTIHISSIILQNIENIILNLDFINRLYQNNIDIGKNNTFMDITKNLYMILENWLNSEILLSVWIKYRDMFSDISNEIISGLIYNNIDDPENLDNILNIDM